jgi:hypothetical protein
MTKTLNPLHFEDLEPHRFEDLVRQVIYDFKEWSLLEPTGRLGSDDGYDARGFEIVKDGMDLAEEPTEDDEGEGGVVQRQERLWQIQCKREKSISASKITHYLDQMIPKGSSVPYGVIFAAATDFSKKTRDAFRKDLREKGVKEFYLWGNADLEDMLYQPKNDHLLYAYFGISLQIQRRSQKSNVRGILATKRKTIKHLGPIDSNNLKEVLIRDVDDEHYPYSGNISNFKKEPAWKKFYFVGHEHDGIQILIKRFFAYRVVDYEPDGVPKLKAWDFTDKTTVKPDDQWNDDPKEKDYHHRVYAFWNNLDEGKQAHFEIVGLIKYENIVDIDPEGDIYARCPHVYVRKVNENSFCEGHSYKLAGSNSWAQVVYLPAGADKLRVKIFPDQFPDPTPAEQNADSIQKKVEGNEGKGGNSKQSQRGIS